jgi:hypothetical protein
VLELFDVNLFHPLYVDEAGHSHGAASSSIVGSTPFFGGIALAVHAALTAVVVLLEMLSVDRTRTIRPSPR